MHRLADISIMTHRTLLKSGWVKDFVWKRRGFVYSDYTRGTQRLFD
jgi:hypothetical protein